MGRERIVCALVENHFDVTSLALINRRKEKLTSRTRWEREADGNSRSVVTVARLFCVRMRLPSTLSFRAYDSPSLHLLLLLLLGLTFSFGHATRCVSVENKETPTYGRHTLSIGLRMLTVVLLPSVYLCSRSSPPWRFSIDSTMLANRRRKRASECCRSTKVSPVS